MSFRMLVDMGDLPQPDKDVLSEEIVSTRRHDLSMFSLQQGGGTEGGKVETGSNGQYFQPLATASSSTSPRSSPRDNSKPGSALTQHLLNANNIPLIINGSSKSNSSNHSSKKGGRSPHYNAPVSVVQVSAAGDEDRLGHTRARRDSTDSGTESVSKVNTTTNRKRIKVDNVSESSQQDGAAVAASAANSSSLGHFPSDLRSAMALKVERSEG